MLERIWKAARRAVQVAAVLAITALTGVFCNCVRDDGVGLAAGLVAGLVFGTIFVFGNWAGLGQ